MRGQLQAQEGLCDLKVPYGVSAAKWLTKQNAEPNIAQSFGRFMADFLASSEYVLF